MKIGAFEELVLLAVGSLGEEAYGVAVKEMLESKTGKNPSIGALHSALYRLEDKGCLVSHEGGATSERGGRRKKYYQITSAGKEAIMEANKIRMEFSKNIEGLNLGLDEA
ncbi:PadR family transcriptional regulator [Ekhidna sp.]